MSEGPPALRHLERNRYFLQGGDGYFLAGKQLFRVHKYFFERESQVFKRWFQSSGVPGGLRNGETESTAIVLDRDVPPASFEKLLNVFYNDTYSFENWPVEDWKIIIRLAQKWEFPEVLELAIRELSQLEMPLITRVETYQKLNIDKKHLLPLYKTLCSRPQALTESESEAITLKTTVSIFTARERLRAQPPNSATSPLPTGIKDKDVTAVVAEVFGIFAPSSG